MAFHRAVASLQLDPNRWLQWTDLLKEADASASLEQIQTAYRAFLARFPFCFGYWQKLAAHVERLTPAAESKTAVVAVYEAGALAVPHSTEHWLNFCKWASGATGLDDDAARGVFERAARACSLAPDGHKVHFAWIDFELSKGQPALAAAVYTQAMRSGAAYTETVAARWREWAVSQPSAVLVSSASELAAVEAVAVERRHLVPDAPHDALCGAVIMERREADVQSSLAAAALRAPYEALVSKRLFFHYRPLEPSAILGWRAYLAFEEAQGDAARIEKLYGRCLVACANYVEFWLRYADYKYRTAGAAASAAAASASSDGALSGSNDSSDSSGSSSATRDSHRAGAAAAAEVLKQAATVHHPRRVDVQLAYVDLLLAAGGDRDGEAEAREYLTKQVVGPGCWGEGSAQLRLRLAHMHAARRDTRAAAAEYAVTLEQPVVAADDAVVAAVRESLRVMTAVQSGRLSGTGSSSVGSGATALDSADADAAAAAAADESLKQRDAHEAAVAAAPSSLPAWHDYAMWALQHAAPPTPDEDDVLVSGSSASAAAAVAASSKDNGTVVEGDAEAAAAAAEAAAAQRVRAAVRIYCRALGPSFAPLAAHLQCAASPVGSSVSAPQTAGHAVVGQLSVEDTEACCLRALQLAALAAGPRQPDVQALLADLHLALWRWRFSVLPVASIPSAAAPAPVAAAAPAAAQPTLAGHKRRAPEQQASNTSGAGASAGEVGTAPTAADADGSAEPAAKVARVESGGGDADNSSNGTS